MCWEGTAMKLEAGKVAVVTAAASGMGRAMCRRFAASGMHVVMADVDEAALDEAAQSVRDLGVDAVAVPTDVADPTAVERLRDAALDRHGAVHLLCSHAGAGGGGPVGQPPVDLDGWHRAFEVTVFGVLHGINAFLPAMLEQDDGYVVNTSSRQGLVITPGLGAYCPSKFAVVAVTEMLDAELRERGSRVRTSVLCPGGVRTRTLPPPDTLPPGLDAARRELLTERYAAAAEPEVVADLVARAIEQERLYILTHGETVDWMQQRFARIQEDLAALGAVR
jgi:NAD(P)-dependent dehydrogenase (short-subunit alcohol dehydrogenase family)